MPSKPPTSRQKRITNVIIPPAKISTRANTPHSSARANTPPSSTQANTPPSSTKANTPPSSTKANTPPSSRENTPPSSARENTPHSSTKASVKCIKPLTEEDITKLIVAQNKALEVTINKSMEKIIGIAIKVC